MKDKMRSDRQWIDDRLKDRHMTNEFIVDIEEFMKLVESHPTFMDKMKNKTNLLIE